MKAKLEESKKITKPKVTAVQEHKQHEHRQCGVDIVEAVDVEGCSWPMTKGLLMSVWVCWD